MTKTMKSSAQQDQAVEDPFGKWIPLHRLCIADLPEYGCFPAVYAMRHFLTKEILKYGATQHLRQRIFLNFICGWGGSRPDSTTQRVHSDLFDYDMIERTELAWMRTSSKVEALRIETQLRREYMDAHKGLRPHWDRMD